jgi:hypothetical protein
MTRRAAAVAALLTAAFIWNGSALAQTKPSFDDTAKILAGMAPAADSPLAPLTNDRYWKSYAQALDKSFAGVTQRQLDPIRDWVKATMPPPKPTLFYMFGGPDFLYANAFFPNAKTYVLVGLESSGAIPDVTPLQKRGGISGLSHLQHSMRTLLAASFFITADMSADLRSGPLRGTLPILYVFLARSGKQIVDVSLVEIDDNGSVQPDGGAKSKASARGAKIVFKSPNADEQTLYHFSTDLSDAGVKKGGFLKFLDSLGTGDSFVKSASYLMHGSNFGRVREFLVAHSAAILQDDTGVPLRFLEPAKWRLTPFGNYLPPFEIFPGTYQPKLKDLFRKEKAAKIPFGVGYRWRPGESNLLLAVKNDAAASK